MICVAPYKSLKNLSTESGTVEKNKLMQQYPFSIWMNLFLSWLVEEMGQQIVKVSAHIS